MLSRRDVQALAAVVALAVASTPARGEGEAEEEVDFDTLIQELNAPPAEGEPVEAPDPDEGSISATVRVPLDLFMRLYVRLGRERAATGVASQRPPRVVIGESHYTGEQRQGALALRARLAVTLSGDGEWKTVPLVGDDVVLASAS